MKFSILKLEEKDEEERIICTRINPNTKMIRDSEQGNLCMEKRPTP